MRKTDEGLRQHENLIQHWVAVSVILIVLGALAASGLLDNVVRLISH
jgi:hypothetical protein